MTTRKLFKPNWAVHPGEVVREAYQDQGISLRSFAARLGVAPGFLSDICRGRRAVGPRMALRLDHLGIGSAEMWVQMQAAYDLASERRRAEWRCDWTPDDLNPGPDCPYCAGQMCARFDGLRCTHDLIERHGYRDGEVPA